MKHIKSITANKDKIDLVIESILECKSLGFNIFLLSGDIGMGKTFLVSSYAKQMGFNRVTSPSFSFSNEYPLGLDSIFHYDLYLNGYDEREYELFECVSRNGVHFIEWGNKDIATRLCNAGFNAILIEIKDRDTHREYRFYKMEEN